MSRFPQLTIDSDASLDEKMSALTNWHDKLCSRRMHNGTILVAKEGNVLFHRNCGYRESESRKPVTNRSAFNLASASKQFTAMGMMLLAKQGRLSIDDSLDKWLPELDAPDVTIRHLLHHTAGLADYMALAETHWNSEKLLTFGDLIALFQKYKPPPLFVPGEKFEYSNTGYVLLALIIERAAGTPHTTFMNESIFRPLGMNDSAAFNKLSASDQLPERVFGFRRRFHWFGRRIPNDLNYLDGVAGDGGIYASARDLLKWDQALSEGTLLAAEHYAEAYRSGWTNDGKETGYGFGWQLDHDGKVSHGGGWVGFSSTIVRIPERRLLLVVLDNSSNSDRFWDIAQRLDSLVDTL